MKKALKTAPRGTAFNYAGQRWVVLEHNATGTLCLTEKIVEDRAFDDGNCNDFSKSSSLRYLNGPFLDTLIDAAGCSSAFLTSELDLTADDGLKDYGTCTVTIFLLTVDQYRRNRDVIPNADDWWWLSTAFSTASNGYEHSARCVGTDGALDMERRLQRQPRPAPRLLSGLRSPDLLRRAGRDRRAGRRHRQGADRELRRQLRHRGAAQSCGLLHARHAASHQRTGGAP